MSHTVPIWHAKFTTNLSWCTQKAHEKILRSEENAHQVYGHLFWQETGMYSEQGYKDDGRNNRRTNGWETGWILDSYLPISAAISNGFLQVVNLSTETRYREDNQSTTRLQLSRDRVRDIFTTCGNPFSRVEFDLVNIVTSEVVVDEKIVSDITCVATKRKRGGWGLSVQQERRCEKGCTPNFPFREKNSESEWCP